MALNLKGFVTPEDKFEEFDKSSDLLSRENYRNQQLEQQKQERKQHQDSKRLADAKFLESYYDPKAYLSGTVYDPEVTKKVLDIRGEAQKMIADGVTDTNMITSALAQKANQLYEYSQKAKYINDDLDKKLRDIPANSGYIKHKLREETLRTAFYDDAGKLKDMATIDPKIEWMEEAVKKNPLLVTDNTGLNEYLSKVPKSSELVDVKTYDSRGGFARKKWNVKAPGFMQLDMDERGNATRELVPKYEIATDDENPIIHPFVGKDGKIVNAPIRLADEQLYTDILKSNHAYADNLRGQVMAVIKEYKNPDGSEIKIDSPQATNVARALLYTDIKNLQPGSVEDVVETKPAQIHNYGGGGGGNGRSGGGAAPSYSEDAPVDWDRIGKSKTGLAFGSGVNTDKDGVFLDKNGQPFTGEQTIHPSRFPKGTEATLKASGIDISEADQITLLIENGRIEAIRGGSGRKQGKIIYRQDMFNSQLKQNSEPIKSTQPTYGGDVGLKPGGGTKPPPTYSQITETDKGTIGVKNGKWYYTKTGKPVE